MDDTELLVFAPRPDPVVDPYRQDPEGTYSRLAWLPVIGPSSWLMWGTLACQLRREPEIAWELATLAAAHGIHGGAGGGGMVRRTLNRLVRFRLLTPVDDRRHLVRMTAPPVTGRQLERLPDFVVELHHQTFGQIPYRKVG